MPGRTLAIGDIHGCDHALETLLQQLALTSDDTVIFLGDIVDRGPGTRQAIDRILELRRLCDVVTIMGNHEEMMRDAISRGWLFEGWLDFGGRETLNSYGGQVEDIPAEHLRFLTMLKPWWETEHDIFVHAAVEPHLALVNQTANYLRWKHIDGSEPPHVSGKRIVCGHTRQTDGVPLVFNGWACIDTDPNGHGWLSCLDADTNQVTQANQKGKVREFPLSKYA